MYASALERRERLLVLFLEHTHQKLVPLLLAVKNETIESGEDPDNLPANIPSALHRPLGKERTPDAHAIPLQNAINPIANLGLEKAEHKLHRALDVLEFALLRCEVACRASSKERLEDHVVGERDGRVEGVDVEKVRDKALLADNMRGDLFEGSTERLAGKSFSAQV
jgi:hypothetical protein